MLSGSKSLTSEDLIRELGIEKTFLEGVVMILEVDAQDEPDVELAKDLVHCADQRIVNLMSQVIPGTATRQVSGNNAVQGI